MEERVPALIQALKDKDTSVRQSAVTALARFCDLRAVEPLIQALQDSDSDVRSRATTALGDLRDPHAVEPLIQALQDSDWLVHNDAANALGHIGVSAVESLIQALKDNNDMVRSGAAQALSIIGDFTMVLRKVLADSRMTPQQRYEMLELIRQRGHLRYPPPPIDRYCRQMLDDEDPAVRDGAMALLEFCILLRPVERVPETEKDRLLRPAEGSGTSTDPEKLLRPSDAPEPAGEGQQ